MHAGKIESRLKAEVAELLSWTEAADRVDVPASQRTYVMQLAPSEDRRARATIEARAKKRHARKLAAGGAKTPINRRMIRSSGPKTLFRDHVAACMSDRKRIHLIRLKDVQARPTWQWGALRASIRRVRHDSDYSPILLAVSRSLRQNLLMLGRPRRGEPTGDRVLSVTPYRRG